MNHQPEVTELITSSSLMVISTLNQTGRPQAAVVGFGQTDDMSLVFGTSNTSRKYRNLQHNPQVAVVIGWDSGKTVQYEGEARELAGAEAEKMAELYYTKNPHARQHHTRPDQRYFLITPQWVRYTDLTTQPWNIIQLEF